MKPTKAIAPFIVRNGERVYLEPRSIDLKHTDVGKTIKAARKRETNSAPVTPSTGRVLTYSAIGKRDVKVGA